MTIKLKKYLSPIAIMALFVLICFLLVHYGYNIDYFYLISSFFLYLFVIGIRAYKLKIIIKKINFSSSLIYTSCSQLLSAFIPGRAGEFVLSAMLKIKYQLNISRILPTLFVDKLMELFFVCMYCAIFGLLFFKNTLIDLYNKININPVVILIISSVVCIIIFTCFIMSNRIKGRINIIFGNIKEGLTDPVKEKRLGIQLILFSLLVILMEYLFLFTVFRTFHIDITYIQIIIVHSLGMLIGIISLIPGGQGATEVSMVTLLVLWGFQAKQVLPALVLSKGVTYVLLALVSIPVLEEAFRLVRKRKQIKGDTISDETRVRNNS